MNPSPSPSVSIPFDATADTNEGKEQLLNHFLSSLNYNYNNDGTIINNNKFLFLYGAENTGRETILKKVAKQLFGTQVDSKLYIRIDSGQKFPYKLHANKVESSHKVIFVTGNADYWGKWKELFPHTKAFQFVGQDTSFENNGILHVNQEAFVRARTDAANQMKESIRAVLEQHISDEQLRTDIHRGMSQSLTEFFRTELLYMLNNQAST